MNPTPSPWHPTPAPRAGSGWNVVRQHPDHLEVLSTSLRIPIYFATPEKAQRKADALNGLPPPPKRPRGRPKGSKSGYRSSALPTDRIVTRLTARVARRLRREAELRNVTPAELARVILTNALSPPELRYKLDGRSPTVAIVPPPQDSWTEDDLTRRELRRLYPRSEEENR
jgi:hypothetical protein